MNNIRESRGKKLKCYFVTLSWKIHIFISIISSVLPRPAPFNMGGDYSISSDAILEAGYHTNYDIKLKFQNFMICLSLDVSDSPSV